MNSKEKERLIKKFNRLSKEEKDNWILENLNTYNVLSEYMKNKIKGGVRKNEISI